MTTDLAEVSQIGTPDEEAEVTGTDGKTYTPKIQDKPRRYPLPDSFRAATWKVVKATESVGRLVADDRFRGSREGLASANRGELERAYHDLGEYIAALDGGQDL